MRFEVERTRRWPFYKYELLTPFQYIIKQDNVEYIRTLPKGWNFDGATFGWLIDLRDEASMEPAAIHDDMYEHQGIMNVCTKDDPRMRTIIIKKKAADDRYIHAIDDTEEGGVNAKSWQRALVKLAFNTFGYIFWKT